MLSPGTGIGGALFLVWRCGPFLRRSLFYYYLRPVPPIIKSERRKRVCNARLHYFIVQMVERFDLLNYCVWGTGSHTILTPSLALPTLFTPLAF